MNVFKAITRINKGTVQTLALLTLLVLFTLAIPEGHAFVDTGAEHQDLTELSLEALLQIKVTTVSKSPQKLSEEAAAVYVLTREDIRRSGYRRLPEILRMVPGLHVARQSNNRWAISSRNTQSRFTSTMLVMIDGRSVYTPFYAGVYWELLDTYLEDIERIEVVRGPGGALWGANAVDGIINIITTSSTQTHGIKTYALGGSGEMRGEAGLRYGAGIDEETHYRLFAKGFETDTGEYLDADESSNNGLAPVGHDADDDGRSAMAGFRVDWARADHDFMLQGNIQKTKIDEERVVGASNLLPNQIDSKDYNLTFDWQLGLANNDSIQLTTYFDYLDRDDDILDNNEQTFDLQLQHNISRGRHQIAWGGGYRYYANDAEIATPSSCGFATPCFGVDPETAYLSTYSAFFQDRIRLSDSFTLIAGSKFEENDYTGFEYQPTLRAVWTPDSETTYWAAASRAVRIPDRINTDGILDFNLFEIPIGNKDKESSVAYSYELGYRKNFTDRWSIDATVFYSDWRNTVQETEAGLDELYGFEGVAKYQPYNNWLLELGYTYHYGRSDLRDGGDRRRVNLPEHSAHLRSLFSLNERMELDTNIYYVDDSKSVSGDNDISDYLKVDLRCGWQVTDQIDLSLLVTNLFDDVHAEDYDPLKINSGARRSAMLKITFAMN